MAAYNKFDQFMEDVFKGVHNFTSDATSTITVALCGAANAPDISFINRIVIEFMSTISDHLNIESNINTGVNITSKITAPILSIYSAINTNVQFLSEIKENLNIESNI